MFKSIYFIFLFLFICLLAYIGPFNSKIDISSKEVLRDNDLIYAEYSPKDSDLKISRLEYQNKLYGFWLGQCIANWTGLITEMDKIGDIGDIKTGNFYTMEDWGGPDLPNIWSKTPSDLSSTIDFVFVDEGEIWGADDDTDIEYIYQYLHFNNKASILSGKQIKDGWLKHIKKEEENYLWVSNQAAFDLMQDGLTPPETSLPENNPHFEMIDAQLTTEIFGLFAPGRPDVALELSKLPIKTTARYNAEWIAQFYVIMHSLASFDKKELSIGQKLKWMAEKARNHLPNDSYSAKMFDFVKQVYVEGVPWEKARDMVYDRYQVRQKDGYDITSKNLHCNGCFAAGINFASSMISLFYGEGDIKKTIKIGSLCGWDSDNPTSTWGGLIGFMIGKDGIERSFGRSFSNDFNIHRTRIGFPNKGLDTFDNMAQMGVLVIDRVVQEQMGGGIDLDRGFWYVPYVDIDMPQEVAH